MYELYIGNKNYSSWSLRPWILLRELEIPFTERLVPFAPNGSSWEAFRRFSPSGRVPCLIDSGHAIWESLAIVEYVAEHDQRVWPSDPQARAWARCAAAEMHAGFAELRKRCSMSCGVRVRLHEITDGLAKDLDRIQELWNQGFSRFGGQFLAGNTFTAVDAFFCPVAFRVQTYDLKLDRASTGYVDRLLSLKGMRAWQNDALHEPWRDASHEVEVKGLGTVVKDLREQAKTPFGH
ncbi:MAG: glutathione S-transferase family protein [Myxococcaceae bacterium]